MTTSEIAYLAVGLVLGAVIGAALAQVLRGRSSTHGEVRLTITPNAIPAGRTRTLAGSGGAPRDGHAPISPEAGALADSPPGRTRVPSAPVILPATAVALPVGDPGRSAAAGRAPVPAGPSASLPVRSQPESRPLGNGDAPRASIDGAAVVPATAVAVMDRAPAPFLDPLAGDGFTTLVRPRPPVDPPRPTLAARAVPVTPPAPPARPLPLPVPRLAPPSGPTLTRPPLAGARPAPRSEAEPGAATRAAGAGIPESSASSGAPCAEPRRSVEERCALADVAREQARAAADALREAQRAYDVLRDHVDRAEVTADPRRVAAEKDRLHAAFRAATDRAGSPDDTEAAARAWLDEVNALNAAVREAHRIVEQGSADLRAALPDLERRSIEADAARIASENAEAGCREARQDLATCEEAEARARQAPPTSPDDPHPFEGIWPEDRPELPDPNRRPSPAERLAGLPVITRVLRGDRQAREGLVAALAAGDPDGQREWGLRIARLVDAIAGRAIEDGYLDLPEDDPFWRLFELREARDIVGALSALGFRYDGLGGFADGRVPAARDLSLAVGYAGLDRMRIRTWPREADIAELYAQAVVAADEWLADQAGDLSLGQMVDALGGRAAELADVWNAWGRVRPQLLAS